MIGSGLELTYVSSYGFTRTQTSKHLQTINCIALWEQTEEMSFDWSSFWQVPSVYSIIVAALLAIGISFFFKLYVKPKIEVIFEQNLQNHLYYIFNYIEEIDAAFDRVKDIFDNNQTIKMKALIDSDLRQCKKNQEELANEKTKLMYLNTMFIQQVQLYIMATIDYMQATHAFDNEHPDQQKFHIKQRKKYAKSIIKHIKKYKLPAKFVSYEKFLARWEKEIS